MTKRIQKPNLKRLVSDLDRLLTANPPRIALWPEQMEVLKKAGKLDGGKYRGVPTYVWREGA